MAVPKGPSSIDDGFVVVAEARSSSPCSDSSGEEFRTPLAYQSLTDVFMGSISQAIHDSEARIEAKMAAAVAKAADEHAREIEVLKGQNAQLAATLSGAESKAARAEERCAALQREVDGVKGLMSTKTFSLALTARDHVDAFAGKLAEVDKRTEQGLAELKAAQADTADKLKTLAITVQTNEAHLDDVHMRLIHTEDACEDLERDASDLGKRLDALAVSAEAARLSAADKPAEGRVQAELQRTQDSVERVAAQLKSEKARADGMFVKISALSLALRGGRLPTDDARLLPKIAAWLESFKARTTDSRTRERAERYVAEIEKKAKSAP